MSGGGGPVGAGVGLDVPEDAHGHFPLAVRPVLLEGELAQGVVIGGEDVLLVRLGIDGDVRTAGGRLFGRFHGHGEFLLRLGDDGNFQDLGYAALQPDNLLLDGGDVVLFRLGNSRKRGVCRLGDGLLYGWLVRKVPAAAATAAAATPRQSHTGTVRFRAARSKPASTPFHTSGETDSSAPAIRFLTYMSNSFSFIFSPVP